MTRTRRFLPLLLSLVSCALPGILSARPLFDSAAIGVRVGRAPYFQAVGDLDRDGLDDLVIAVNDSITILLSNPDSTFRRAIPIASGRVSRMAIARVGTDELPDLVVTPADQPVVRVYMGCCGGSFGASVDFPFEHRGNPMVVRDLNGDGLADVAIPRDGTVWILPASADSLLGSPRPVPVGHFVDGLVGGDINADGDVDLVALDAAEGKFSVLLNNGAAAFSASWQPAQGISDLAAMGRLDGDKYEDLAIATGSGVLTCRGTVDGTFVPAIGLGTGPWHPDGIACADIDGDGIDEVITSSRTFIVVHHGTPTGPEGTYQFFGAYQSAGPLVAGHFDGDRHADLCTLEYSPTGGIPECDYAEGAFAFAWHGNGASGFGVNPVLSSPTYPRDFVATDFDRDGDVDLVVSSGPQLITYPGKPDGSFGDAIRTPLPSYAGRMILLAPVSGDSVELAVSIGRGQGTAPGILVLRFAPDGSLVPVQTIACPNEPADLAASDFDSDGRFDLAATMYDSRSIRVFFGQAGGGLAAESDIALPIKPRALVVADLDRDDRPDLVVGGDVGFFDGSLLVLLGDGERRFAVRDSVRTPYLVNALAVSTPANADPILAVGASQGSCLTSPGAQFVFRSVEGVLALIESTTNGTASPTRMAFADVDGDGRDDLVTGNGYGEFSVRPGLPNGAFGEVTAFGAGNGVFSFQLADVDRDGRLDACLAEVFAIRILHNVGGRTTPWPTAAARLGAGLPEAILVPTNPRAVSLSIAGDPVRDARRIVPGSVRLAGAPTLRGRERLHDEVRRLRPADDACIPVADGTDGFADLTVTFASADVLEGWRRTQPDLHREGTDPVSIGLPWEARTVDGTVVEGSTCAIVIPGDPAPTARFEAYGPDTRTDLGVGLTLDLPSPCSRADVDLYDVAGRRVATLHRGSLDAGFHRLPWSSGSARPGLYFAQARLDDRVLRTRLLILR